MSKSTPISELQNNGSEPSMSTQPLVQDILKEIQQEENVVNNPNTQDTNVKPIQPQQQQQEQPSTQDIPQELDNSHLVDTSDPSQYEQQQQQALQYQLDPNINNHENPANLQDPSFQANMDQQMSHSLQMTNMSNMDTSLPNSNNMDNNNLSEKTLSQKIFIQARDPLLVMLISILLSVPIINGYLIKLIARIPGGSMTMIPISIKALITALLFYTIRKLF